MLYLQATQSKGACSTPKVMSLHILICYLLSVMKRILCVRVSYNAAVSYVRLAYLDRSSGCKKGKRECVYPEPATSSKNPRSNSKKKSVSGDSGSNSSEDDEDDNELDRLPSIPDDEDATASTTTAPTSVCESIPSGSGSRHSSNASGIVRENSPISPKDASTGFPKPQHRPQVPRVSSKQTLKSKGISNSKWATLPKDVRFYMNYHKNHLSHHHYAMKYDTGDFLKTTFLEIALGYEPLLYAVTGFAAYHHTLTVPNGKIQHFLGYYNKSVSLLRVSLERSPKHSVATLLTILQLATFEVSLLCPSFRHKLTIQRNSWATGST